MIEEGDESNSSVFEDQEHPILYWPPKDSEDESLESSSSSSSSKKEEEQPQSIYHDPFMELENQIQGIEDILNGKEKLWQVSISQDEDDEIQQQKYFEETFSDLDDTSRNFLPVNGKSASGKDILADRSKEEWKTHSEFKLLDLINYILKIT